MTPARGKVLLGLIGAGIQRSLTPALHEAEGGQHGLRVHYQLIDLDASGATASDLPLLIAAARIMGFAGLNITYPCKQAVLPLLDELAPDAQAMGAVNTVVNRNGRLVGHNTDGWGWRWGFRRALPDADLSRVVLLGAGGAGSAVAHSVLELGAQRLAIVDVDPARSAQLAESLARRHGADRVRAVTDAAEALADATGLIHATPTGMDKMPGSPLAADLLRPELWVSEIVYFPIETALLKAARARGCATVDGGTMAVGQAIGAFQLFTGIAPDAQRMDAHLRAMLAAGPA
ncbi:shikimate dehydrogenase [Ramlibacter sp. RBP-2]|uniref:Shikimate dehydrogenase (NADP(+)) n=1 Tax=Ramlibacter lithotrophicus TaxID=2606681 RepID=A0A7X6DG44_9BURK|nr:shikimate dehydrogenase [Ramlibacter lithotrophicus]